MGGIGVFNAIVEQCAQDCIGIQSHFHHDLGNGQGVDDVGRSVLAFLLLVFVFGVIHRLADQRHICTGHPLADGGTQRFKMDLKGFQK